MNVFALANSANSTKVLFLQHEKNKGPDNPTSQLLPIIRKSGCSGTEKEEKTKEMVDGG